MPRESHCWAAASIPVDLGPNQRNLVQTDTELGINCHFAVLRGLQLGYFAIETNLGRT